MSNYLTRGDSLHLNDVKPSDESFFNGFVHTGKASFDPFVSGYAFIKWIAVPSWIDQDFKLLSERNFKAFGGLSDIELETDGVQLGFTANNTHYTKGITKNNETFTLKYQEHSGSPLTSKYNKWVSGIRDPRTGIATYPKEAGLPYHSSNHTGALIYVVTRPDADNFSGKNIEFAALYTHVQPKKIFMNHLNYETGSHEYTEQEQEFTAVLNIGEKVDKFVADRIAAGVYKFTVENNFDPSTVGLT